jgi:hypothetical protein
MDHNVNENVNTTNRLRQGFSRFGYWIKKVAPLYNILMPILYIVIGCLLFFSPWMKEMMPDINRYLVSGLLMIYGVFRAYRIIKIYTTKDEDQ